MIKLGFTLSSEEFGPRDLVLFVIRAVEAGYSFTLKILPRDVVISLSVSRSDSLSSLVSRIMTKAR